MVAPHFLFGIVVAGCSAPSGLEVDAGDAAIEGGDTEPDAAWDAAIDAGDGGDGGDGGPSAREALIPPVTGECPELVDGVVTFAPAGIPPRDVRVWISDASGELDGPLVFYWHGNGSHPETAVTGLSQEIIDEIVAMGGVVAAPFHDPDAGDLPWYLPLGVDTDDLVVADEVLACASASVGVDATHVHALGHSAGALHTAQMGFRRASYLASVVTYSGGLVASQAPETDDATHLVPALIFHGGETDVVVVSFQNLSERYWSVLDEGGHYAAICDTGMGHTLPRDARPSAWRFLRDHPFGALSPYETGLPEGFYASCSNQP